MKSDTPLSSAATTTTAAAAATATATAAAATATATAAAPRNWSETGLKHLPTHHLSHIAQSGRFGTPVLKQIFEKSSRQPLFYHTFLTGNKAYIRSLNSPWGFWPFWKSSTQTSIGRGQSTPLFRDTCLRGSKAYILLIHLEAFDFQNGRFGNQLLKQILEEGSRHLYFVTLPLGEIILRSLNSPRDFWFPKRPCSSSASFPGKGQSPVSAPKKV